jgi:hypothetical protein
MNHSGPNFPSLGSLFPLLPVRLPILFYHLVVGRLDGSGETGLWVEFTCVLCYDYLDSLLDLLPN